MRAAAPARAAVAGLPGPAELELRAVVIDPGTGTVHVETLRGFDARPARLPQGSVALRLPGHWHDDRIRRFLARHGWTPETFAERAADTGAVCDLRLAARRFTLEDAGLQRVTDRRDEAIVGEALLVMETTDLDAPHYRVMAVDGRAHKRTDPLSLLQAVHVAAAWAWRLAAPA